MTMFMLVSLLLVGFALVWAFVIRPRLMLMEQPRAVIVKLDDWLSALWLRSRTILIARLYVVLPALVALHDYIADKITTLDLTPVTNRLLSDIPPDMRPLMVTGFLMLTGLIFELLRKVTDEPLSDKPSL